MNPNNVVATLLSYSSALTSQLLEQVEGEDRLLYRVRVLNEYTDTVINQYPDTKVTPNLVKKINKSYGELEQICIAHKNVNIEPILSMMIKNFEVIWDKTRHPMKVAFLSAVHKKYMWLLDYFDPKLDRYEDYVLADKIFKSWKTIINKY